MHTHTNFQSIRKIRKALTLLSFSGIGLLSSFSSFSAHANTVFACEPEWAALTRVLLPDATIHIATHAKQDPHHIEARPALIAQLRSAQVAVCTGAELETGWLPMLQQRAGNPRIQDGAIGMFYAAEHIELMDQKPNAIGNPFSGDVHAKGNPHFHTNPHHLLKIANALAASLGKNFPQEATAINKRADVFSQEWKNHIQQWESRTKSLQGMRVAGQHTTFSYLWNWLGIVQIADLEPKPGMAPTPSHIQQQLVTLKATPVAAVVIASYQDPRAGRWITSQTGIVAPLLILPPTTDNANAPNALIIWYEQIINQLLKVAVK